MIDRLIGLIDPSNQSIQDDMVSNIRTSPAGGGEGFNKNFRYNKLIHTKNKAARKVEDTTIFPAKIRTAKTDEAALCGEYHPKSILYIIQSAVHHSGGVCCVLRAVCVRGVQGKTESTKVTEHTVIYSSVS